MNGLRSRMQRDLARLIGQLPVLCGFTPQTQTIPCAWLSQRDEVRFAQVGLFGDDSVQIIAAAADLTPPSGVAPLAVNSVFYVSGHRYRVRSLEPVDTVSMRITLDRSDQ